MFFIRKIKRIIFLVKDYYKFLRISLMDKNKKFSYIYKSKYWKNMTNGSLSGGGSNEIATCQIKKELRLFIDDNNIKSIIDIPCGDWKWMSDFNLSGIVYTGYDVVDGIIESNKSKYLNNNIDFYVKNLINESLPKTDLIIIRDLLVHLDESDIIKCLHNIDSSEFKYVGITNYPKLQTHKKRLLGDYLRLGDKWRPLNFTISPFNLPQPDINIPDMNELSKIDRGKYLSIWNKKNFNLSSICN